jgi:hypothetical protein
MVMENHEFDQVLGNPDAPYLNALASRSAVATNMFAIRHPSLPNYLALLGGSTFGVSNDCTDCFQSSRNLVDELDAARISWRAYMEGLPAACDTRATAGNYALKHDPFLYFDDIRTNAARCRNVVPGTQLSTDLASGKLPKFVWLTPDLCHDTHDCSVATGDRYLAATVPPLLNALGPHGVLILTYDEGTTNAGCCRLATGGHILTVVAGPDIVAGAHAELLDHYSILRTLEEAWHLPLIGGAGCACTRDLHPFFRSG